MFDWFDGWFSDVPNFDFGDFGDFGGFGGVEPLDFSGLDFSGLDLPGLVPEDLVFSDLPAAAPDELFGENAADFIYNTINANRGLDLPELDAVSLTDALGPEYLSLSAPEVLPPETFAGLPTQAVGPAPSAAAPWYETLGTKLLKAISDNPLPAIGMGLGGLTALAGLLQSTPKISVPDRAANLSPEERTVFDRAMAATEAEQDLLRRAREKTQAEAERYGIGGDEVSELMKQKILGALRGEDELADPTLLREQEQERAAFRERALREGGPGALTSTWWANQLNDLLRKQDEARTKSRLGVMTDINQQRLGSIGANLQRYNLGNTTAEKILNNLWSGLGNLSNIANFTTGLKSNTAAFNAAQKAKEKSDKITGGSSLFGYSLYPLIRRSY